MLEIYLFAAYDKFRSSTDFVYIIIGTMTYLLRLLDHAFIRVLL